MDFPWIEEESVSRRFFFALLGEVDYKLRAARWEDERYGGGTTMSEYGHLPVPPVHRPELMGAAEYRQRGRYAIVPRGAIGAAFDATSVPRPADGDTLSEYSRRLARWYLARAAVVNAETETWAASFRL